MYGDRKFVALSKPNPNAQTLWFYLLTGPHTSAVPGLSHIGEAALAEALDWPVEAFRKAFAEISEKGMAKADWKARVLWIPNAPKYNPPQNPNVVKAWVKAINEIPESDLKDEAVAALKDFLKGFGKGFSEAFEKPTSKPLPNQEQEQEQNQEQEKKERKSTAASLPGFDRLWNEWPAHQHRVDREGCLKLWKSKKLEPRTPAILLGLERWKISQQWNEGFIPKPKKWLKEAQWEAQPRTAGDADQDSNFELAAATDDQLQTFFPQTETAA